MRIHIHCPGVLGDGLDSPSRGEGRWSQNLARLLAGAGHYIVATGTGTPGWGAQAQVDNVILLPETTTRKKLESHGPFDLSLDSAWWKDKPPMVTAKKYLVLKWSLEGYTREEPLPENMFLCYPLNIGSEQFFKDDCVNRDRTFFLPLPLGPMMCEPNFDKKGLLWTCKDIDRSQLYRENAVMVAKEVLYPLLDKEEDLCVIWLMSAALKKVGFDTRVRAGKDVAVDNLVLYHEIKRILRESKLVVSINIPGSFLDAAVLGVPTLEWEEGGFLNAIARKYGALIERGATAQRVSEVIDKYLYDREFFYNYVKDVQHELRFNLDASALQHFDALVEKVFGGPSHE